MSAINDSSQTRPEGQPQAALDAYARRTAGDLAQVVVPQAVQLLTTPTDSPAAVYRLRLGGLIAPLLRLWAALDGRTDRFELYRLLMTGDDFGPELNALLTGASTTRELFITLCGGLGGPHPGRLAADFLSQNPGLKPAHKKPTLISPPARYCRT